MIRFLLLLAAGLTSVQAAGLQVPRYGLKPGMVLWYSGLSDTKDPHGTSHSARLREHWMLSDSGGTFRVLMRVVDNSYRTDTAGKRIDQPAQSGWELFEMTPDGKLLRDQSTIDVDVSALFPPLPPDSGAAAAGWQHTDTFVGSVDHYRLDNKSLSDSLWLIDWNRSTPFDSIYGPQTAKARVTFNTRRGLPLRRESRSADTANKRESQGTIVLDSVTKFDAASLPPQIRAVLAYFDVKKAYDAEGDKADPDDTTGAADKRALAILQNALEHTQDSTVAGMLKRDINQQQQSSAYQLAETKTRVEWRGKPAPAWALTDLDGKKHSLSDYRGKVLVLDWWYKNCPWCMLAMPKLTEVARRYADRPVVILGMNVDKDTNDARFAVTKVKPGYSSLIAGKETAKQYGVTGYPTLFIVDKKGKVADVHVGYDKDLTALLSKKLDALLAH